MKNIFLFAMFVLVITFTSCKKTYTCHCTETVKENGAVTETYTSTYTQTMKEKESETWCDAFETSYTASSGGYTESSATLCDIK